MLARIEVDTQCTIQRHHDLFNGGDVLSMGYVYSLQLDSNAKPFASPACHVPPHLWTRSKQNGSAWKIMVSCGRWKGLWKWSPTPKVIIYKKNGDI